MGNLFFIFYFFVSLICWIFNFDLNTWMFLIFFYFGFRLVNIILLFNSCIPLFQIFSFIYFVDNVFSLAAIFFLDMDNINIGDNFFSAIPIIDYIPFAFLSMQAVLIGYNIIPSRNYILDNYLQNTSKLIEVKNVVILSILGLIGLFMSFINVELGFAGYVLRSFFTCSLISLFLINPKKYKYFLYFGLFINFIGVTRTGMFTSFMFFMIFMFMFYLRKKTVIKPISLILVKSIPILLIGILFLGILQNTKGDYRAKTWQGDSEANINTFNSSISEVTKNNDLFNSQFFLPLLYRLNHSYLVTSTMLKVPVEVDYQYGKTIFQSIIDAFVPRFLNPNKEEAGGRKKIEEFTFIKLGESTSMNIGYLGESYVNFGKYFSILFFLLFGIFFAKFENRLLSLSIKQPYILIFIPIIFECFVGSGIDFMMLFNSLTKSIFFIFIILKLLDIKRKRI
jgi:hypothetical protein